MVAMTIIALAAILSLQAVEQSRRLMQMAGEVQAAKTLVAELITTSPENFQLVEGKAIGFTWSIKTELTGADRPIEVCHRVVVAVSTSSSRQYRSSALAICPREPGS